MISQPVEIGDGYFVVDAETWINQRAGHRRPDDTDALREFIASPVFDACRPTMPDSDRMQLWCAARGWIVADGDVHHHDEDDCLSEPVTIVLATDARHAYALVQVGTDRPVVYHDLTTDSGYWCQTRVVDIVCPGGHRWTWLDNTSLIDNRGHYAEFAAVFGPDSGAPYARCRDCAAYDNDDTDQICPCAGTAIYCPTCRSRCRLELTDVPTHPDQR